LVVVCLLACLFSSFPLFLVGVYNTFINTYIPFSHHISKYISKYISIYVCLAWPLWCLYLCVCLVVSFVCFVCLLMFGSWLVGHYSVLTDTQSTHLWALGLNTYRQSKTDQPHHKYPTTSHTTQICRASSPKRAHTRRDSGVFKRRSALHVVCLLF
jgi:hypothetical protein